METSNEAIVQYLKENAHETYNAQRKSRCHSPQRVYPTSTSRDVSDQAFLAFNCPHAQCRRSGEAGYFCGAAKRDHDLLMNFSKISTQFAEELQLMTTLHHPNIVQFLGVYFFPVPALVMERLLTSFHDLLDPETNDVQPPPAQPHPAEPTPLSFFTLGLYCTTWPAAWLTSTGERRPSSTEICLTKTCC